MNQQDFIKLVKNAVMYYSNQAGKSQKPITVDDVNIVWIAKVLQNNKALAITNLHDSMYYEATFNGDKNEMYVDAYHKESNFVIRRTDDK